MLGALAKVEGYFSYWRFPHKKSLLLVPVVGGILTEVQFFNKITKTRIKKGLKIDKGSGFADTNWQHSLGFKRAALVLY